MLIVPLEEARVGMKLAAPVVHPDNPNQDLLRAGYVLEQPVIVRMRDLGVQCIYADYPELECLDRHLAVYLSPARQAIFHSINQSMTQVQKQTRPGISYKDYCNVTRDLISTLLTQGQNPIYLDQMARQGADAVAHAAAVAHLSLLLGMRLEQYLVDQRSRLPPNRAKDVVNLGIAGMLHDLGVCQLPEELRQYSSIEPPKDESQRKEWQNHARLGYELIHNDVEATASAAVYQHHQHFDGSGFPAILGYDGKRTTLTADRIHIFSRIVSCADLYDRLATPMHSKVRRSNFHVLSLIQSRYASWIDPEIFRVLQMVAPPYPPGYRLRLSDGTHAVVVDVLPKRPLQPIVRRMDAETWALLGANVDLAANGAPTIMPENVAA